MNFNIYTMLIYYVYLINLNLLQMCIFAEIKHMCVNISESVNIIQGGW